MLTTLDLIIFFGALAAVMAVGLIAARREASQEEFFLAGRDVRWWGVAGSIFGSNVSANHLVGMLGIGYSIGFAQSHFELGAVAALMVLAYGFLPVYRKLGLYTLSDYLGRRYDVRSQTLYAVIVILVIVVQLTAAFYIGSRSLGLLLDGTPLDISYETGLVVLAVLTATYTIYGGLKAVIYTDVIQSVLLLLAGVVVAVCTFAQPEVGGWTGMMAQDSALPAGEQKMHLYLPSDHPDLPWSGALTGLVILHLFYWSTNQPIVQRALAAKSDAEARFGILVAGFGKLTIPFFAIGGGVAAAQLFAARQIAVDPDAAMPELIKLVVPLGVGLTGLIMAGLIGAILSSIDSMVNSASTIVAFDLYKKFLRPQATEGEVLRLGKWVIAILIGGAALLAQVTYDPAGAGNFFLRVSSQASHFTPGLVVAFALGMFWRRATALGSLAAISLAPVVSLSSPSLYRGITEALPAVADVLGAELNFMHRVFGVVLGSLLIHVVVSLRTPESSGDAPTFQRLVGVKPAVLKRVLWSFSVLIAALFTLGFSVHAGVIGAQWAAWLGAALTLCPFVPFVRARWAQNGLRAVLRDDRLLAGALCATTAFLLLRFF